MTDTVTISRELLAQLVEQLEDRQFDGAEYPYPETCRTCGNVRKHNGRHQFLAHNDGCELAAALGGARAALEEER